MTKRSGWPYKTIIEVRAVVQVTRAATHKGLKCNPSPSVTTPPLPLSAIPRPGPAARQIAQHQRAADLHLRDRLADDVGLQDLLDDLQFGEFGNQLVQHASTATHIARLGIGPRDIHLHSPICTLSVAPHEGHLRALLLPGQLWQYRLSHFEHM